MKKIVQLCKKIIYIIKNVLSMNVIAFKFSRYQYISAFINCIYMSVSPFINIYFPKWIIDELSGNKEWDRVLYLILTWGFVNLVMITVLQFQGIFESIIVSRNGIRENVHYAEMDAEMDYGRIELGTILDEKNRIRSKLYLPFYAYSPGCQTVFSLAQAVGYIYIIATLHPLMVVFLIAIIFLKSLLSRLEQKLDYRYNNEIAKYQRRFAYLYGAMTGYKYAKEVRINNASHWLIKKYKQESDSYMQAFDKKQSTQTLISILSHVLIFVQTIALYGYSAYCIVMKTISVGDFVMYVGAITGFVTSIHFLVFVLTNMKYFSEYIDGYRQYVSNAISYHICKGTINLDKDSSESEIEFRNVSFKYPNCDNYVLKNVSVTIKSGENLSIVGYNGAGKSTFVKLLCGLYEPTEGCILYNGANITTLNYQQYTEMLSVVFQDFNIYSMSVKENICLNRNVSEELLLDAIEKNGLSDKILGLKNGLGTHLTKEFDSDGIEFSGGEGQKLACARAYYKDSPNVVLDEPTASLDPISESQLYERFCNIMKKKTSVYISHRLASSKLCDRILVFKDGEIVESGTHNELVQKGAVYAEMFLKQAKYYVD